MKNLVIGFFLIIAIIFLIMLFSITSGNKIEFTNLPNLTQTPGQPTISSDNPIVGAENPKVIIVEFGDFANQTSISVAKSLNTLLEKYPDDLAIVWKDFPNTSLNPQAQAAAVAARCAQNQNAFWEFQKLLIVNSDILSSDLYPAIANDLDIWQWFYKRCLTKENTLSLVQDDLDEAYELSLPAAPSIFVNGQQYSGYLSSQELEQIIKSALNDYE
ncbi:MAG: DSBA oxidoreductase [Candidatus Uhrbacteria bacterium GW2011_GWD2_41_121]|uniref:DSBA oxidoreductase n=1 Tax=Candidatus Uhrbacteria bacterium GW2011_GWC1_41_20 TaxID=1618983 RepID=A0A0G0YH18_9BACT|nr:MAG: DSBA oxidoreductase [Candidatus Uhrbacteria bacterium GW2011_GWE1_39_46]KKR64218.1 MAG: DSBA oxidoreductase [Candidatus Uhrbacteria bacterium GW2011_GWC2_40_450]KKR90351.1 MAG: DSBA oxidoreductase [Candidatus Uhrbacteria bacterium GW2011_GWD2_41_121]KKR96254.1 MAG: DSBA oxidoreductase [Candidatus Uhrbacteria bacterium GW2011_GWD1_41_16]KKR99627.1 MAG: DSBA oxidoreductase [Candidatus Uhrbacteria bacterium GW2011_GWC1_41_20]KKS06212.1 MAG: DSBA oxidoreductase [Candidatus Uhrbacteria bact